MIKADIPQDIREYKEQFFFGLNLRQLICAVLMVLLAVGTFLIGHKFIRTDILMYIIVIESAPIAAVGFLKYNGMGFEKIAVKVLDFYFSNQRRKLIYQPEEAVIHGKVKELAYSIVENNRKAELRERKRRKKRGARR
ncbi:MAG: PrgI family protein [Oscillospiraceae bacterium]|nr:PrgI family protein [Oscillospiraceae bacterium]